MNRAYGMSKTIPNCDMELFIDDFFIETGMPVSLVLVNEKTKRNILEKADKCRRFGSSPSSMDDKHPSLEFRSIQLQVLESLKDNEFRGYCFHNFFSLFDAISNKTRIWTNRRGETYCTAFCECGEFLIEAGHPLNVEISCSCGRISKFKAGQQSFSQDVETRLLDAGQSAHKI